MAGLDSHPVPEGVNPDEWCLRVTGAVAESLQLTEAELRTLPETGVTNDFACVEGWRAADLSWRGVRLGAVLAQARPTADAAYVLINAMDGDYACSFSLGRPRDALLAVELDGEPLSVAHGGPARLPTSGDADCWDNVKWVSEIEVTATEPAGRGTAKEFALGRVSTDGE